MERMQVNAFSSSYKANMFIDVLWMLQRVSSDLIIGSCDGVLHHTEQNETVVMSHMK